MILRKLLHLTCIIIPVLYLLTDKKTALIITSILFIALCIFEVLRIKGVLNISLVERHTKEEERKRPLGSFYYVLSGLIVMAFFEKYIAVASLFILSISDPLASIIGSRFGRVRFLGKSLEGTLAFFFSSLCILLAFSFSFLSAITCATISALTELFSSRLIDDNLAVPLTTAIVLTVLAKL
jgi:dolichol kinase